MNLNPSMLQVQDLRVDIAGRSVLLPLPLAPISTTTPPA